MIDLNILSAHVSPWCSRSVYSLFDSTTILDPFSRDADWKQIKPLCTPPRGWTVWPSGCTTSYHNMQSQRWVSSVWTLIWRDKHWKAHSRAHKSLDAEACCDSCCGWDSSRDLICVLVCLWLAQRLSKAALFDVKAVNKLVDQARSTAEMGIVIPCGVVTRKTSSVICYAEFSECGLAADLTHHPELFENWTF